MAKNFRIEKTSDALIVWRYDVYKKQWVEFQHLPSVNIENFRDIHIDCDTERSITWSVEDFEQRALEIEEDEDNETVGKQLFNREEFPTALEEMINRHDCNFGITWNDIDDCLDYYCSITPKKRKKK